MFAVPLLMHVNMHVQIGDVRTNFSMPDVQSIALGGGSLVECNQNVRMVGGTPTPSEGSITIGPNSVEYRIKQEALCFGGDKCTATDIAVAAGVAPQDIGTTPQAGSALSPQLVYGAMREIRRKLEAAIDSMKVSSH